MKCFGSFALAVTFVAPTAALADEPGARDGLPRGTKVWADPGLVDIQEPTAGETGIIYLNGCFNPGDCDFSPGGESSISNRSSIISSSISISPFNAGPTAWDSLVECVTKAYSPFNVRVTDEDPGDVPHFEAVVAGTPGEAGMPSGVGGVAPYSCGVINNAVTYSFANIYGGYIPQICWTAAQETAHAFGLDHEFLCEDPMTYRSDCSDVKWFRDADAPCGEYSARGCSCGGATQNSYQRIRDHFGPGSPQPPSVTITDPAPGSQVPSGYGVRAEVSDDIEVSRVEVWVNSRFVAEATGQPYAFNVPADFPDGVHRIEVRAWDLYDAKTVESVEVQRGEKCDDDSCGDGLACVDGRCVPGPGTTGGLGEVCGSHEECMSGLCGDIEGEKYCVEQCKPGDGGCPNGFGCMNAGDFGVCWPGYEEDTGGCQAGGGAQPLAPVALGLFAALFIIGRRRRS